MENIANLLPIAAFIALAAGLVVVLRGTGRIVARTREVELFRGAVKDLAARVDASLAGAAGQPRRKYGCNDAAPECKSQRIRSDLVAELERSKRALEMVEHGTAIMVTVRRGPRELEAQTSIKRGYLNLIHAREAFAQNAHLARDFEVDAKAEKAGRGSA